MITENRQIHVRRHAGSRAELRPLFEAAEDSARELDSYIDAGRLLVALDGDEPVGHLQLTETGRPDEIELKNMAVAASHRRRGVGRALVAAAADLARAEGGSALVVATASADVGNLRFYQRLGFRMRAIDRDAFTAATGYRPGIEIDGVELRDRVWLDMRLGPPERELYERGIATLIASWERIAQGASGAAVLRAPGLAAAVFPAGPERDVYNNALLERDLGPAERDAALAAMEDAYAAAGVGRFAAWAHESDGGLIEELERRGYRLAETTRAMGLSLFDRRVKTPEADVGDATWSQYLRHLREFGVPDDLLAGVDPQAFHVLAAGLDGEVVATGLALDHRGDCGIYNVSTLEPARRRGLATALTAGMLEAAALRGCTTASLQATPMAESVYAAAGFRDLGRILEHVPGPGYADHGGG